MLAAGRWYRCQIDVRGLCRSGLQTRVSTFLRSDCIFRPAGTRSPARARSQKCESADASSSAIIVIASRPRVSTSVADAYQMRRASGCAATAGMSSSQAKDSNRRMVSGSSWWTWCRINISGSVGLGSGPRTLRSVRGGPSGRGGIPSAWTRDDVAHAVATQLPAQARSPGDERRPHARNLSARRASAVLPCRPCWCEATEAASLIKHNQLSDHLRLPRIGAHRAGMVS
jgi:hypothetical protein